MVENDEEMIFEMECEACGTTFETVNMNDCLCKKCEDVLTILHFNL